jgi:hypothetical protein
MTKIAFTGLMRSGKDTLTNYAVDQYGMTPFAFGYSLKKDFHELYTHIPRSPKPVRGYQLYGQLMRYVHGEDYWVDKCFDYMRKIHRYAREYSPLEEVTPFMPVISDLRQPNEYARCLDEGFIIIRVESSFEDRVERAKLSGDDFDIDNFKFETETNVDNFKADFTIRNEGVNSVSNLYADFDRIMQTLKECKKQ